jgi:hypothetical protein
MNVQRLEIYLAAELVSDFLGMSFSLPVELGVLLKCAYIS